jgi:hypothetical protein
LKGKKLNTSNDVLYHVTLRDNHASITRAGVEPLFARGAKKASWWVDYSRLHWALAHCSARHNASVNQLEVWAVSKKAFPRLMKFRYPGMFFTPCRVKPTHCHASHVFTQEPMV